MTKNEFATLASALKTYWPRENLLPNNEAMTLWYEELKDLDYQVAQTAIRKYVQTSKFPPTIAEIREMSAAVVHGTPLDWSEGWQRVIYCIGKYGYLGEAEAIWAMDEITAECVKRIGWYNICTSDNIMADRANFRTIFQTIAERKRKEEQLSLPLREMMERMRLEASGAKIEEKG